MMMLTLALITSFAIGIATGLHILSIVNRLKSAIQAINDAQKTDRKKNTGVVRPGLNDPITQPDTERKSAVVRPRIPKLMADDTDQALASVRDRTASR